MALLEALLNCRGEEFSNERLVRFLRCEGMNAKLAAQRFVNYWEGRREVFGPEKFGPEKYLLPISLGEALCDDVEVIAALKAGMISLLPCLDLSGRQLLFLVPHRHTKKGYSSASVVGKLDATISSALSS